MLAFIFGCCFGSFFCLAAQRIPENRSLIFPSSHCEQCQTPLRFRELVPLISILLQRFRCTHCQVRLSASYFWAELTCGVIFWLFFPLSLEPASITRFFWVLSAFLLSLTDCFYLIVEPKIFYPCSLILWLLQLSQMPFHWMTIVYCLVLCGIILWKYRERFGFGDVLLLLSWSPWLTLTEFCLLLLLASIFGLLIFAFYNLLVKKSLKELPFVPCLSIALAVILLL